MTQNAGQAFGSEAVRRSHSGRGWEKPLLLFHSWRDLENIRCHIKRVKNPVQHQGGAYGAVWRARPFISCSLFSFLEGCLPLHLLLACRAEARPVTPSSWELDSQNGPLHLSSASPFYCLCVDAACLQVWLSPCADSRCLQVWHGSQGWRSHCQPGDARWVLRGQGGQPHFHTGPKVWWMNWLICSWSGVLLAKSL